MAQEEPRRVLLRVLAVAVLPERRPDSQQLLQRLKRADVSVYLRI